MSDTLPLPLVSVIITCYNQGRFLGKAISSVLQQGYQPLELIVVDDGSTDETRQVAERFGNVQYHFQKNAGLSAARNQGIALATGTAICFLDADDWFLPQAIQNNVAQWLQHPQAAFVAGAHKIFWAEANRLDDVVKQIPDHMYTELLCGNFIGMHACVMYNSWIFKHYQFDTKLAACEDYDLYLRIAKKHPTIYHHAYIAVYQKHGNNMSDNADQMLSCATKLLQREMAQSSTEASKTAALQGIAFYNSFYIPQICDLVFKQYHQLAPTERSRLLDRVRHLDYLSYLWLAKELNFIAKAKPKQSLLNQIIRWLKK